MQQSVPLGTDKTETMLATQVYRLLDRSLVPCSAMHCGARFPRNSFRLGNKGDDSYSRNLGTDETSTDSVALLGTIAVVAAAGTAATLLPARRASRVQIASMMREN
ncbi:hypothetical protein EDE15_4729 [Edaphobacter aggregans]|uniref:Uncharacterized protein n=1 Tax=Edaphobacter aggregans TaxID=570835 RepID=A0A428MQG0_9BACT|nr:hypothetical protein EDE15_4729 [Edaphobacter aggregans]